VTDPTNPGEINNVDIDIEMGKLAENEIAFNFATTFIKDRSNTIGEAIKGNRGE